MLPLHEELPPPPASLDWLGRPPLTLPGVRDHALVVVFWRVDCVHSRIALDEIERVVRRFTGRPVAVLAVHVAVTEAERDVQRVRRCLAGRHVIGVIDVGNRWSTALALRHLPTLVLVDGRGQVEFAGHGEPRRERLAEAVLGLVRRIEQEGRSPAAPLLPLAAAPRLAPRALLSAPEGVWLAAAGHGRLHCLDAHGQVVRSSSAGLRRPTGLALHGEHVIVADEAEHTLAAVDRASGRVHTWCGDGSRSTDRSGGGYGTGQGLAAPSAVAVHDGLLHFANGGTRQLWQFDAGTKAATAWLGQRGSALRDGHEEATFGGPLAMAFTEETLLVADAGFHALRAIDLAHAFVRTVATGLGRPGAIAVLGDEVFVADACAPAVLRGKLPGEALAPWLDASHGLVEPVALAAVGEQLWIADDGIDGVFVATPAQPSVPLRRLTISGAAPFGESAAPRARLAQPLQLLEFSDATLRLPLEVPAGERIDAALPCTVHVADEGGGLLACDVHRAVTPLEHAIEVLVPIADRGTGALRIRIELTTRVELTGLPNARCLDVLVPLEVGPAGAQTADVRLSP